MSYRRSKNSNSTVFSTFPSKRNRNKFGLCPTCKRSNTNPDWCQICNSERFRQQFCHWTSGSKLIDDFIKDTQLSATNNRQILEWIPYSQFNILKFAATGGFASVYSAIWRDGFITKWNYKESKWERRSRWGVALKVLNDSAELASAFLEEVKACVKCGGGFGLIRCYGLSQDPTTKNFIIVLYHAHHGSLKSYLGQHYGELDWTYKLGILNQIAEGLKKIHQAGLVHKDFHSGNILLSNYAEIADLGFTGPVSKKDLSTSTTSKHKHVVYGVLPYISPEVLRGIKYDYVADVYSFGIVMWEVATCLPPFNDRAHDAYLALDICLGLRPNVEDYIPEPFVKLMTRCWDAKPSSRPSAHDIYQTLHTWYWNLKDGDGNAVTKSFINADSNDFQSSTPASSRPVTQTHPLAVYTSRLLNFHDLPEPVNALHTTGRRIPITSSVGIVSNDSLEEYRTRQLDDELSFENCFSDRIETVTLSEVTVVSEKEEQYVSRQVNGGYFLGKIDKL